MITPARKIGIHAIRARSASECIPGTPVDSLAGASGSYGIRFVRIVLAGVIRPPSARGMGAGPKS
jgi:hypothetical protein